ncbi:carbohydrate-binding protein [Streptomyces indicus]|uniref:Carbohydrate binding module (Family 6) n=1 Tax=Streptomyces indicus TaxID=417292 RepID=A0A1G9HYG0_9ACTN|nr:carbohydrate-binding protein [Streptomyces indicus]SDL17603.1 Carbohydrate binding module (family 6) [Streptomyces indicus]
MTTPGDNGARTPEEEDPFGYLYADGQAAGATPPPGGGGYGYPGRASYNQVRTVGERQYGQQTQQPPQGYGQQGHGQPQGYDQAHYSAPETFQGDATRQIPPQQSYGGAGNGHGGHGGHGGGGRGRGPNTKGLLIGAIAVVAAVVVGIGVAILGGDDGEKEPQAQGTGGGATTGESVKPSEPSEDKKDEPVDLPKTDAKVLKLTPPATTASDVKGAKAGTYVAGFNQVGASLTWQIDGFEKAGSYSLRVTYAVPGEDTTGTLTVNGDRQTRPLNMKNWANAKPGEWEKGWTTTFAVVDLKPGTNTITLSCEQSDKCNSYIDQMWLVEGTGG